MLGKPEPFSSFDLDGLFFHPSTSSFVLNVVRFPCHQLWLRRTLTLCCTSFVMASFMWKHLCSSLGIFLGFFGTFLSVTSVVFLELLFGPWTSELLLLFSSHFYSFCFLSLGSFHVFFFLLLYCCVCGWMGVIVLPSSATTLRVLLCAPSECMLRLRQCCSVLLLCLDD